MKFFETKVTKGASYGYLADGELLVAERTAGSNRPTYALYVDSRQDFFPFPVPREDGDLFAVVNVPIGSVHGYLKSFVRGVRIARRGDMGRLFCSGEVDNLARLGAVTMLGRDSLLAMAESRADRARELARLRGSFMEDFHRRSLAGATFREPSLVFD